MGYVGNLNDSYLAHRNDTGKDAKVYKQMLADKVKKINDEIAKQVEYFLLNKDDFRYIERLRDYSRRR